MIIGAHAIIYSKDAEADREFLRDVLKFPSTDAGQGWLIFGLPPSELAVHPSADDDHHELFLMCDDITGFTRSLREKEVECSPVREERWGSLTRVSLPGGGKLGVYQPKHPRPLGTTGSRATKRRGAAEKRTATRRGPLARRKGG